MNSFIDIHTHIAWGVDDGISSFDDACKVLALAKQENVKVICATPHYIPGRHDLRHHEEVTERMKELQALANTYQIKIEFGSEIFLNNDYLAMIESKQFHTLANSNYILVEFDVRKDMNLNEDAEDKLYECLLRGYQPIIAHVERYFHSGMDMKRIQKWIEMGCLIQINRTSLMYKSNKYAYQNAMLLLKHNLVHLVASDTHSCDGRRICKFSDIYQFLRKEVGEENAILLCYKNANKLINNEPLDFMTTYKRSLFSLFKK